MKKLPALLFLLLLFPDLRSQEYVPMAVENAHWFVAFNDHDLPLPCEILWEYFSDGDSLINDLVYKKIYKVKLESDTSIYPCVPPFHRTGNGELAGLIRDDILSRKVYSVLYEQPIFTFCPVFEETELYDFSLELGDSVNICLSSFVEDDTITTIQWGISFGVYSKHLTTSSGYNTVMYEGIGSSFGLFEAFFVPYKKQTFNYFLYDYCRSDSCDLLVDIDDRLKLDDNHISVYPNPATSKINIRCSLFGVQNSHIVICDLFGRKVLEIDMPNSLTEVDVGNWQKGLYIVRVITEDGIHISEKILVK